MGDPARGTPEAPETALVRVDWTRQSPALVALRTTELRQDRRIAIAKLTGSAVVVVGCLTLAVLALASGIRPGVGLLAIFAGLGVRRLIQHTCVVRTMNRELAALPEARVVVTSRK